MSDLPKLFTPEEIAEALRCSAWWVKEQARRKRVPFTKAGGAYRFTAEHFDAIVQVFEERPGDARPQVVAPRKRPAPKAPAQPVAQLRVRQPRRARREAS